jgi:release factor H-coupled RctB family protein
MNESNLEEAPRCIVRAERAPIAEEALRQFDAAARLPGCVRAAAMPDLHPGRGIPVGAAYAFVDCMHPALVGNDAGCGATVITTRVSRVSVDRVLRRLTKGLGPGQCVWREFWDDGSKPELFSAVWKHGATGLLAVGPVPRLLEAVCSMLGDSNDLPPSPDSSAYEASCLDQLGSIGGGNHFAELTRISEVFDAKSGEKWSLTRGDSAVLVHSGSRGLGQLLAERWRRESVSGEDLLAYWGELAGACRFARANRALLAFELLRALGISQSEDLGTAFDIVHNGVTHEALSDGDSFVHRKGAAPAHHDQPTVVLGSRGAPSWIMRGLGNPECLSTVAHGAGRKLSRSEALCRLRDKYRRNELQRTPHGSHVWCEDPDLLYEEHPDAYKPIGPVIEALEQAQAAHRVASLMPLLTVKR